MGITVKDGAGVLKTIQTNADTSGEHGYFFHAGAAREQKVNGALQQLLAAQTADVDPFYGRTSPGSPIESSIGSMTDAEVAPLPHVVTPALASSVKRVAITKFFIKDIRSDWTQSSGDFAFRNATYTESTNTINAPNAFRDYTYNSGDRLAIYSPAASAGVWRIAGKTDDDNITLSEPIHVIKSRVRASDVALYQRVAPNNILIATGTVFDSVSTGDDVFIYSGTATTTGGSGTIAGRYTISSRLSNQLVYLSANPASTAAHTTVGKTGQYANVIFVASNAADQNQINGALWRSGPIREDDQLEVTFLDGTTGNALWQERGEFNGQAPLVREFETPLMMETINVAPRVSLSVYDSQGRQVDRALTATVRVYYVEYV